MSFKNLRSPGGSTDPAPAKEQVAPFPHIDDGRKNGDPVNTTFDGEAEKKFGPAAQEARPPMKLKQ